jgi:hypothetical protein
MNIGKRVRPQSILHPICTVSRTTFYNMIFFLLSVIVAAILVTSPSIRNCIVSGGWTRSGIAREDFSIARGRTEQSRFAGPVKPFLVVVLPDGTIVTPTVAGQV